MAHAEFSQSDNRRALHVKEAARIYGLSRTTIYQLMKQGTLRTVKIGGRRLITRDALESLILGARDE
jgi:excisionase family DNA binding protein